MKYVYLLALVLSLGACSSVHKTQRSAASTGNCGERPADELAYTESESLKVARNTEYKEALRTQTGPGKRQTAETIKKWFLKELSFNSLLRDQIAEDLSRHENNGRNSLTQYYSTDRLYCQKKVFGADDVEIKQVKELGKNRFEYEATITLENGFSGGFNTDELIFSMTISRAQITKSNKYSIDLIGYPVFKKLKEAVSCEGSRC